MTFAIVYYLSGTQEVVLSDEVLQHFRSYRQLTLRAHEAGGQLFGTVGGNRLIVRAATGPRAVDRRSRFSFSSDARKEQEEINRLHRQGLHYLGDWHTHPTSNPKASAVDIRSIGTIARMSVHPFNGFLLIVVGTADFPDGLQVIFHDGAASTVLDPG